MNAGEDVKLELADVEFRSDAERRAFLSAAVKTSGSLHIESKGVGVSIETDSSAAARAVCAVLKALYSIEPEIECGRPENSRKKRLFSVEILPKNAKKVLSDCGVLDFENDTVSSWTSGAGKAAEFQAGAFMRGIFMCAGTLSLPESASDQTGYYMALEFENDGLCTDVAELLKNYDISMRLSERGENKLLYIKSGEKISDFLALCGASRTVIALNCVITDKMAINDANRYTNCTAANLGKIVGTGMKQCEQIKLIDKKIGISSLSDKLQAVARARLDNPDMTYDELAELIGGSLGKSGINHRFRKISEIAEKLKD